MIGFPSHVDAKRWELDTAAWSHRFSNESMTSSFWSPVSIYVYIYIWIQIYIVYIYIYNPSQRHDLNCNLQLQCLDMINMCSQSLPAFHQCFEAILREVNPQIACLMQIALQVSQKPQDAET